MTFFTLVSPGTHNVKQYGAVGDGATNDTAAIATAIAAANNAGGGTVFFPAGIYITGNQTLASNVHLCGAGVGNTTLKLKNSSNTDLLSGSAANVALINLNATYGSGTATNLLKNFSMRDMTLDGNAAGQGSTSYGLRFYGAAYVIDSVRITNTYSGGWLSDFNGGPADSNSFVSASYVSNVQIYNTGGIGFEFGGPHDSECVNFLVGFCGSHCIHVGPNAGGTQFTSAHAWAPGSSTTLPWFIEAGQTAYFNCVAEGGVAAQVALLASNCTWDGYIFPGGGVPSTGFQLGQSPSTTLYPNTSSVNLSGGSPAWVTVTNCCIRGQIIGCTGTNGALFLVDDGGNNSIDLVTQQTSGSYITGTPAASSTYCITGSGLTPDGSQGKSSMTLFNSKAFQGFRLSDGTKDYWTLDSQDGVVQLLNGAVLAMYSGNYTGLGLQLAGGTINLAQSSSAPDPGASGTITTTGVGIARVNPSGGSRSGCILQAGTQNGQVVIVNNENASNSITFATSGTSHVAQGTSVVIAANGQRVFVWTGSLWY